MKSTRRNVLQAAGPARNLAVFEIELRRPDAASPYQQLGIRPVIKLSWHAHGNRRLKGMAGITGCHG